MFRTLQLVLDRCARILRMHESTKERELHALEEIAKAGKCICHELHELRWLIHAFLFPVPRALQISQIIGGQAMPITGIIVGATGTFASSPSAPPGAVEPAGTTRVWTTSDTVNTVLTPSADGTLWRWQSRQVRRSAGVSISPLRTPTRMAPVRLPGLWLCPSWRRPLLSRPLFPFLSCRSRILGNS